MKQDIKSIVFSFIPAFLANLAIWYIGNNSELFKEIGQQSEIRFYFKFGCYSLIIFSTFFFINSIYNIIKIRYDSQNYFREQFSLVAFTTCICLSIILVTSYILKLMPWHICLILINYFKNRQIPQVTVPIAEYLVVGLILLLISSWLSQIHQGWDGKKSTKQYEKEQSNQDSSFINEGIGELLRILRRQKSLEVYVDEKLNQADIAIKPASDFISKAWRDQACELIRLSSSAYAFDQQTSWRDSQNCWVGENVDTKKLVVLYPVQSQLSEIRLQELDDKAHNIADIEKTQLGETIVIFKNESDRIATRDNFKSIRFETEKSLLDNLVYFRDYYNEITKRVAKQKLPEANWTLNNVYVSSAYISSDNQKSTQTIEEYLQQWLNESSKKQIALLGEYGQGKSSAALMFVYHVIDLAKQNRVRIPILIELRGKSPRNLTPLEILASWASQYRIDPQALLRLHIAGRLLIIFEGFDEMALIGNFEE